MEKIFKSWINLSFCNEQFELSYRKIKDEKIKSTIKTYTLLILILAIIASITDSFFYKYYDLVGFKVTTFTSYGLIVLYIIIYILSLKCEKMLYLRLINYTNFFIMYFVSLTFRYPLVHYTSSNIIIFYNLLLVEIIGRLIWVSHGVLGFAETIIIIILTIITIWSMLLSSLLAGIDEVYGFLLVSSYSMMIVLCLLFAYFFERSQKQYYFYYFLGEKRNLWFNNIFDNMHTGLLSIKGQNLTYINSFLFEKILKITKFQEKLLKEKNSTELNLLGISPKKENIERIDFLKNNFKSILKGLITKLNNVTHSKYYIFN